MGYSIIFNNTRGWTNFFRICIICEKLKLTIIPWKFSFFYRPLENYVKIAFSYSGQPSFVQPNVWLKISQFELEIVCFKSHKNVLVMLVVCIVKYNFLLYPFF